MMYKNALCIDCLLFILMADFNDSPTFYYFGACDFDGRYDPSTPVDFLVHDSGDTEAFHSVMTDVRPTSSSTCYETRKRHRGTITSSTTVEAPAPATAATVEVPAPTTTAATVEAPAPTTTAATVEVPAPATSTMVEARAPATAATVENLSPFDFNFTTLNAQSEDMSNVESESSDMEDDGEGDDEERDEFEKQSSIAVQALLGVINVMLVTKRISEHLKQCLESTLELAANVCKSKNLAHAYSFKESGAERLGRLKNQAPSTPN